MGGLVSMVGYAIVGFGLYKLIQIATELGEIKEVLKEIRRNTDDPTKAASTFPQSAESLVRAIHSGSYSELTDDLPTHSEPQR